MYLLAYINWNGLAYFIKDNTTSFSVLISTIALLFTIYNILSTKYEEKKKKRKIKENDFNYFLHLLDTILSDMKEQANDYKHYSDGFEKSLFGANAYLKHTFYNLAILLDNTHEKSYEAFIYRYDLKKNWFEKLLSEIGEKKRTPTLKDFNNIYKLLSEFNDIYKNAEKKYINFHEKFLPENLNKLETTYPEEFNRYFSKYLFQTKHSSDKSTNEIYNKLSENYNEFVIKSTDIFNEAKKNLEGVVEDNKIMEIHYIKKSDDIKLFYNYISKLSSIIAEKVNEDELVTNLYFTCSKIKSEYSLLYAYSYSCKTAFKTSCTMTLERYENIKPIRYLLK